MRSSPRSAAGFAAWTGLLARLLAWALLGAVLAGIGERYLAELGPLAAFRLQLAALAALMLLGGVVLRAWGVALPAGLALLAALATLGPVWASPERPAAAGGRPLTLLFANVWMRNPVPQAMQAAILSADADVVVLAEAPRMLATGPLDAAYPHRVVRAQDRHPLRTAIWSRYPLAAGAVNMDDGVGPNAAAALVEIAPDAALGLIGVHFARATSGEVEAQLEGLGRLAAPYGPPRVVIGDFNAAPWSRVVAEAAARSGTVPAAGFRVTWRGRYPLIGIGAPLGHQIDHLLASPGVGIAGLETVSIPGSDHLGLLARLVVPAGTAPAATPLPPAGERVYGPAATR